uniref:VP2 protein n=1 Tax=Zeugodacus cucurbitae nora virus 4 TaxID=3159470 RepID=A0AAU7L0N3_9VIRU
MVQIATINIMICNRIKNSLYYVINSVLRSIGVMIPVNELSQHKGFYVFVLVSMYIVSCAQSFLVKRIIRFRIADNILRNTGFDEHLNALHFLGGYVWQLLSLYLMYKCVTAYLYEITYPIRVVRDYFSRDNQRPSFLASCLMQLREYPLAFASLVYQFTKVESRSDLISSLTILSSLLKLPQNIWDTVLSSIRTTPVIEGQEEMIEEISGILAVGLTLTKAEIGDIDVGNFILNVDRNQRACDNIIKRVTPLLTKIGLVKDSNYSTILEVAKEVNELVAEETWLKINLRTSPNVLLETENAVRIETLRRNVALLRTKLNTLTTKELRSDKVVCECQKILATLETLLVDVSVLEKSNQTRVKPVGVCIQGEKQIGKTNLVDILTKKVTAYVEAKGGLAFRNAKNWNTWCIQSRDEFDTGYFGQEITYDDDAFQKKDNTDHERWFTFISNSPVGTNQADLKQKGLMYKSKLVFATCNFLPTKSITIEDIDALHARFPHTIVMRRNEKPMPKGSGRSETYDWVDMFYGPMGKAVSAMSSNAPSGSREVAGLVRKTMDEIVKLIGDDLILQEAFYKSCIAPESRSVIVQGVEQAQNRYYESYINRVDIYKQEQDPAYGHLSEYLRGQLTPFHAQKMDETKLRDYTRENMLSFRAWNVIHSMVLKKEATYDEWFHDYLSRMIRSYEGDDVTVFGEIKNHPYHGLQLMAVRTMLAKGELWPESQAIESQVEKRVKEYLDYELKILDSDIVCLALAKLALSEVNQAIVKSTWKDVGPWVMALQNKVTGKNFVETLDVYPCTLADFLLTLENWEVIENDTNRTLFKSFYTQKMLFIPVGRDLYAWSPLIERGMKFVKVTAEFRDLKVQIVNKVSWRIDWTRRPEFPIITSPEGQLQNGLPINLDVHMKWIDMVKEGKTRNHTLVNVERIHYLWGKIRYGPFEPSAEQLCYLQGLQERLSPVSRLCKQVRQRIADEVSSKYTTLANYYTTLTRDGMGGLLSILSRLGIPINDYWNDLLVDKAPVLTGALVATVTSLLIIALVKMFRYGIEGEEQSKGEKRAKQKKIVTTKLHKLKMTRGKEQAEGDSLDTVWRYDLGDKAKVDTEIVEDLLDHLSEVNNLHIAALSLNEAEPEKPLEHLVPEALKHKPALNFSVGYGAWEESYDFDYVSAQCPEWKIVDSDREEGRRVIRFKVRGYGTMDEATKILDRVVHLSDYYKPADWLFEMYVKKEGVDDLMWNIELSLLSAISEGKVISYTRAHIRNIANVATMLNSGAPVDIKEIVTGTAQSESEAHSVANSIILHNQVKLNCLPDEDVNIRTSKGVSVYGLASGNVIMLPAHAVRYNRWIRFCRPGNNPVFGIAFVEEGMIDTRRDIAVADIMTKSQAETKLQHRGFSVELSLYDNQTFQFRSLANHLLTREQAEVSWMDCQTLHYFGSSRTFALGKTTTYEVMEYEIGTNLTEEKKLVASKQMLESSLHLSQRGDCGSPVILATGKKAGKLLGFHAYLSAGRKTWYSAILTQEDLKVITGAEHGWEDPWEKLINRKGLPTDLPNGPEVEFVGQFARPSPPVTNNSLDHWHKSPFADQFEEQLAPGRLDPYDPYIEAELPVNRAGRKSLVLGPNSEMAKELPQLDQSLIDWCVKVLTVEQAAMFKAQQTLTKVSDDIEEVLDYALNGSTDNDYVRGMEINKAAGLPWSLNGTPKKSDFITLDEETGVRSFKDDVNGNALKARVKTKLQQALEGRRILSFSSSKLKDQPIKIAQAKSGRTRVFHCIPVDLILFQASLYGPYKEAYTRAGLKAFHAVGIDPKSVGWAELAAYMTRHPNYFDADYKNYDKYLHRQVYKAVRKIQRSVIQIVCPDNWDIARAVEEEDAIDTYVVDYATVYKTNRANKSGSYTTTIDNCLANDLYGLYAWVKSTGVKSLHTYRTHVSSVAFGDDIIKSVSDKFKDRYNYITYRDVLNETGHVITPGSKDGEEKPFTTFENLQFLKRGFKMYEGMVLAPLLQRSIEGPFVWTDILEEQTTVWVNLVREQLIEACLWGEDYYYQLCDKLKCGNNRDLNAALAPLLENSWEETFREFHDRYYVVKRGNF